MRENSKIPHKIIWTLQSQIPIDWIKNINLNKFIIEHVPLINLVQTLKVNQIIKIALKFKKIIITSPFASRILKDILDENHSIYVVGEKSKKILSANKLNVLKCCNSSIELSQYISENKNDSYLHLCSEKTDFNVWPNNVDCISFYKPQKNNNFRYEDYLNISDSTIVFGSPSGADIWFENNRNENNLNYACMGLTTANQIKKYVKENSIIFPKDSKLDTLIKLITEKINA